MAPLHFGCNCILGVVEISAEAATQTQILLRSIRKSPFLFTQPSVHGWYCYLQTYAELRIANYRFRTEMGAWPFEREYRGSKGSMSRGACSGFPFYEECNVALRSLNQLPI